MFGGGEGEGGRRQDSPWSRVVVLVERVDAFVDETCFWGGIRKGVRVGVVGVCMYVWREGGRDDLGFGVWVLGFGFDIV